MTKFVSGAGKALAAVAALAMTASPAMARHNGYRHHDRIDAGDVIAGVLILGGIAAVASAASSASKNRRDTSYRYPDGGYRDDRYRSDPYRNDRYRDAPYRDDNRGYGDRRDDGYAPSGRSGEAVSDAVDTCVGEVERGNRRVDTVDTVSRTMDGYRVEGRIGNGRSFTCTVDGGGQIRSVAVDGQAI